ncbi:MAG TPA: hypothetical protein PLM89_02895, partial [Anaerolineales bacterium]|nr:hypothetical protein [Anaerolineales bacterium]
MTKNNDKTRGGEIRFSAFRSQIIILGLLTTVVMGGYFLARPFWDIYWLPILITAIGLITLVLLSFWRGLWRNYRWIVGSTILILLVLTNVSWAKSLLSINALEKRQFIQYHISDSNTILHVEYPSQILYDSQNTPSLMFWVKTPVPFSSPTLGITAEDLLLGIQASKDSPVQWERIVQKSLPINGDTLTILLLPVSQNPETTKTITLPIEIITAKGSQIKELSIKVEGRLDAQHRKWANAFLETGGIIVSLALGVFAALKQLDDEKKRQTIKQAEQLIASFDSDLTNDISIALKKQLESITANWNELDKALQDQFRDKYSSLVEGEKKLWGAISGKTLTDIKSDVELCLQVCERIFERLEEKPISTLKQLQSALLQDDHASLNMLAMLKKYPASINIAKIIASAFPPDLKRKTIDDYIGRFPDQIRALKVELGFSEVESYPLQEQLVFYAKEHLPSEKLTAWLNTNGLNYSPFADADNPFYSVFDKQLVIAWVAPGFALPVPNLQNITFEFGNSWDTGAALFEYCTALQYNIKVKEDVFFVIVAPSMVENYEADHPRKLYLHALAEQWEWMLAETPTLFYSLKDAQFDLVRRLLRWHDFSPAISIKKIAEFARHFQEKKEGEKKEDEDQRSIWPILSEWLTHTSAEDLRAEEINALIGLRPLSKNRTLFLVSAIDQNPHVERQISSNLYKNLEAHSSWLRAQNCGLVGFQIGDKNRQAVTFTRLISQCNDRVRYCAAQNVQPDEQIHTLNNLFTLHDKEEAEKILARKANGSPGRMVRLGQKLLLQHVEKYPPDDEGNYKYLH